MKVGSLIQHRRDEHRGDWGLGIVVDQCIAGTCLQRLSVRDHWVIHFPNRKCKASTAEFIHTQISEGLDKDNLKWLVVT